LLQADRREIEVPDLPTYRFLPLSDGQGDFGFVTFLKYEEEDYTFDRPDQARFYYRQMGRIAAMAQIAGITDLHHDNLIAHKRLPHFIDLEFAFDLRTLLGGNTGIQQAITDYKKERQPTKNFIRLKGQETRTDLYSDFIGDIMLGYFEGITALQLADLDHFLANLPTNIRIRCALEDTATFSNWPFQIITGTNQIERYAQCLLASMDQELLIVTRTNQIERYSREALPETSSHPLYPQQADARHAFESGLFIDLFNADTPIFSQSVVTHQISYHDANIFSCNVEKSTSDLVRANIAAASSSESFQRFYDFYIMGLVKEGTAKKSCCVII
jgi:hypothetical protein